MHKFYKPSRIALLFVLLGIVVAVYLAALYKMQIYDAGPDDNAYLARNVSTQEVTLTADRGDILDRNGNVLVSTRAAYNVMISRDKLPEDSINDILLELVVSAVDFGVNYNDSFPVTPGAPFSYVLDMTTSQRKHLDAYFAYFGLDPQISASDLIVWMKEHYKLDYTTSISDVRLVIGVRYELELFAVVGLDPYVFANDVGIDFITLIKDKDYPGVSINPTAKRVYYTTYAAHLLGYIGKVSAEEYADKYKELGYSYNAMVGKDGIERVFEEHLHGTDGKQEITTGEGGVIIDEVTTKEPVPGDNIILTLDIGLQEVCEDSLSARIDFINADRVEENLVTGGAVVVTAVKTGEVLASASYPSYDLSTIGQTFNDLLDNPNFPMLNRATMGIYNPGSTFKMITALTGLKSGIITPTTQIECTGIYTAWIEEDSNFAPTCWIYPGAHGNETVVTALRDSCNYFFYTVADLGNINDMVDTCIDFGLGSKTGIELPEKAGILGSPEYKMETLEEQWYPADSIYTGIGQSYNHFTPIQLANYVATIANGGSVRNLTILSNIRSSDFTTVLEQPSHDIIRTVEGTEYLPLLQEGMELVASDGTAASVFKDYMVPVAAKTGTVQTSTDNETLNNGVFVCYAPADDPEIAIALVVEKGTSGSTIMKIARDVMDYYFGRSTSIFVAQDNTILP